MSAAAARLADPARLRPLRGADPAGADPARTGAPEAAPARRLRLVPQIERMRGSMRWVGIAGAIVGIAMLAQLVLTIVISQGAYEAESLEGERLQLERESTALEEQLSTVESPQNLTAQATALGMQPSSQMQAIDPVTGQVIEVGGAARATPNPALVGNEALTPTQPNAANPNVVPAAPVANGVSADGTATAPVPSATELAAPTTR